MSAGVSYAGGADASADIAMLGVSIGLTAALFVCPPPFIVLPVACFGDLIDWLPAITSADIPGGNLGHRWLCGMVWLN